MNKNIRNFILEIINFKSYDVDKLSYYLDNIGDYEMLQRTILQHRIGGIVYTVLNETNLIKKLDSGTKEMLENLYERNKRANNDLETILTDISSIITSNSYKYVLLKGAYLIPNLYEKGQRVSNDIDILISQENIDLLDADLIKNNYVQKIYREDIGLVEPTRKEKVFARMNYGELIPYFKDYNLEYVNPAIIDVNISLDFQAKENSNLVDKMLDNRKEYKIKNEFKLYTLDKTDFLIHLCCHLYKEATIIDWVKELRDTHLYKYCDIYLFLLNYFNDEFLNDLEVKIKEYHLEKECYYTFATSMIIFPSLNESDTLKKLVSEIKPNDLRFMKQIYSPIQKTLYEYKMDFKEWIFCEDKLECLKEI